MKITLVASNNRRKALEVDTREGRYLFPYAVLRPAPTRENGGVSVCVDDEMGEERR